MRVYKKTCAHAPTHARTHAHMHAQMHTNTLMQWLEGGCQPACRPAHCFCPASGVMLVQSLTASSAVTLCAKCCCSCYLLLLCAGATSSPSSHIYEVILCEEPQPPHHLNTPNTQSLTPARSRQEWCCAAGVEGFSHLVEPFCVGTKARLPLPLLIIPTQATGPKLGLQQSAAQHTHMLFITKVQTDYDSSLTCVRDQCMYNMGRGARPGSCGQRLE